jgi:hypothetical protein
VVFGKAAGFAANIDLSSLAGTTGFKLSGEAGIFNSGTSVASAGDVNGDGFADLIVGSGGVSYVVFGHASGFAANIELPANPISGLPEIGTLSADVGTAAKRRPARTPIFI